MPKERIDHREGNGLSRKDKVTPQQLQSALKGDIDDLSFGDLKKLKKMGDIYLNNPKNKGSIPHWLSTYDKIKGLVERKEISDGGDLIDKQIKESKSLDDIINIIVGIQTLLEKEKNIAQGKELMSPTKLIYILRYQTKMKTMTILDDKNFDQIDTMLDKTVAKYIELIPGENETIKKVILCNMMGISDYYDFRNNLDTLSMFNPSMGVSGKQLLMPRFPILMQIYNKIMPGLTDEQKTHYNSKIQVIKDNLGIQE